MIQMSVMRTEKVRVSRMSTLSDCLTLQIKGEKDEVEIVLYGLPKDEIIRLCRILGDADSVVREEKKNVAMPEWLVLNDVYKEMGV